jgi:zinc protease
MICRMLVRSIFILGLSVAGLAPAAAVTIERVVSPGGIEAWLVHDRLVPVLSLEFIFRGAGATNDPAGKEGLSNFTAAMMVEGAGDLDSQKFQQELEDRSISISFDTGLDTFRGSFKALNEQRDMAIDLLRLALTQPRFDEPSVERVRARTQAGLSREAESPDVIGRQTWMATAFPEDPYGRPSRGTPDSVAKLRIDDMRALPRTRLARDNLVIGAVGDITPAELGPLLDRAFAALPAKAQVQKLPDVTMAGQGRTIVVRRAVPQSVVMFGAAGLKRSDPDFHAASLVNYVLGGGGFNSRLTHEVREKRGLAYSVYSYLSPVDRGGLLMGGTANENSRVGKALEIIRAEWQRMGDDGPTEQELIDAKTYINGSFALGLDSTGRIAALLASMQYDNLGIDYLDRRAGLINGVTLADAKRVARRLLHADRLLTVVVGEPEGVSSAESPNPKPGGG